MRQIDSDSGHSSVSLMDSVSPCLGEWTGSDPVLRVNRVLDNDIRLLDGSSGRRGRNSLHGRSTTLGDT